MGGTLTTTAQRAKLHGLMSDLIAHAPQVHYAERRPMQATKLAHPVYPLTMDCSESVTALCKWAGLKDPNGAHYDGTGYTGTLLANLPHYRDPRHAYIGALAVFGPGSGDHVAMVLEPDHEHGNPVLFSHGTEAGPVRVTLTRESALHRPPTTFLSIAGL